MSFTTGALFLNESLKIASLFSEIKDWEKVRDIVIEKNLLQARTLNTSKRFCREVISRLNKLSEKEMRLLIDGVHQEQRYILWIAICRRYRFIRDFSVEVLREHFITLRKELNYEDFDAFFNKKAEWHNELEKITPTTKNKLRQVLFKMLREADLLTSSNTINPALLSPRFFNAIENNRNQDILVFPVLESGLARHSL